MFKFWIFLDVRFFSQSSSPSPLLLKIICYNDYLIRPRKLCFMPLQKILYDLIYFADCTKTFSEMTVRIKMSIQNYLNFSGIPILVQSSGKPWILSVSFGVRIRIFWFVKSLTIWILLFIFNRFSVRVFCYNFLLYFRLIIIDIILIQCYIIGRGFKSAPIL